MEPKEEIDTVLWKETPSGIEIRCKVCNELLDRAPSRAVAHNRAGTYLLHFDKHPKTPPENHPH